MLGVTLFTQVDNVAVQRCQHSALRLQLESLLGEISYYLIFKCTPQHSPNPHQSKVGVGFWFGHISY